MALKREGPIRSQSASLATITILIREMGNITTILVSGTLMRTIKQIWWKLWGISITYGKGACIFKAMWEQSVVVDLPHACRHWGVKWVLWTINICVRWCDGNKETNGIRSKAWSHWSSSNGPKSSPQRWQLNYILALSMVCRAEYRSPIEPFLNKK